MDTQTPEANPKKLFVGNIPYSATDDTITEIFSPYGELVSVRVITDKRTGRSKGIAFVEFAEEADAKRAEEELNQSEMDGRQIFVQVARPQQPREDRGGFRGGDRRGGGYRGGGGGGRGGFNRGGDRNDRGGYGRSNRD